MYELLCSACTGEAILAAEAYSIVACAVQQRLAEVDDANAQLKCSLTTARQGLYSSL